MNQKGSTIPLIAIVLIIAAGIGGYISVQYQKMNNENTSAPVQNPYANTPQAPTPVPSPQGVVCTQDAKKCPDGSYVSRQGPKCEFAECPNENDQKATLNVPFQLKIREQISLSSEHITLTFLAVTEDSRCPSLVHVQCFWEGQVSIKVNIIKEGKNLGDLTLTSRSGHAQLASKNFDHYVLELQNVDPYPGKQTIEVSKYIARLLVTEFIAQ